MWIFLIACSTPSEGAPARTEAEAEPASCGGEDAAVWLISRIGYARELEAGVSPGFDLDASVTALGDDAGCGLQDFTDPAGTSGIDNQFARVIPSLETTEAFRLDPSIQASIESGFLLLALEVGNIDGDADDDACAEFALGHAMGAPSLGTDDTLEWYQTLAVDPATPRSEAGDVTLEAGQLLASGLEVTVPLALTGHAIQITLHDVTLRFDVQEDGSAVGYFAGGLDRDELVVAATNDIDPTVPEFAATLLESNLDLLPDESGDCHSVSVTLAFTAVPVFLLGEVE